MRNKTIIKEQLTDEISKNTEVIPIVKKLQYLYNMRIPFDARLGLKKIYYSLSRDPISKDITQKMKEFFESVGYEGYASGEYPYIDNPKEYNYLDFVDFNNECSSFIVTKKDRSDFINGVDYNLYLKAYDAYKTLHYPGSEEEAKDIEVAEKLEAKKASQQREYARKEALDELNSARNLLELVLSGGLDGELTDGTYILPVGATWEINGNYMQLTVRTLDAFLKILISGLYHKISEKNYNSNVKYTMKANFDFWNFSVSNTVEKNEELLLELLKIFDNISKEDLKDLEKYAHFPMNKVNYEIIETQEYDRQIHIDMIEEYFEKRGLKDKFKISQEEKDIALYKYFEKQFRERRYNYVSVASYYGDT